MASRWTFASRQTSSIALPAVLSKHSKNAIEARIPLQISSKNCRLDAICRIQSDSFDAQRNNSCRANHRLEKKRQKQCHKRFRIIIRSNWASSPNFEIYWAFCGPCRFPERGWRPYLEILVSLRHLKKQRESYDYFCISSGQSLKKKWIMGYRRHQILPWWYHPLNWNSQNKTRSCELIWVMKNGVSWNSVCLQAAENAVYLQFQ